LGDLLGVWLAQWVLRKPPVLPHFSGSPKWSRRSASASGDQECIIQVSDVSFQLSPGCSVAGGMAAAPAGWGGSCQEVLAPAVLGVGWAQTHGGPRLAEAPLLEVSARRGEWVGPKDSTDRDPRADKPGPHPIE